MKSTGIVRSIDELGRIVLPMELRKTMDINSKDKLEIYVDGDSIVLKKHQFACSFCGSCEDVVNFKDHCICKNCIEELKSDKERCIG